MTKRRTGSIYPERDRQGSFTGRWIREETVEGGKRARTRHATLEAAKSIRETEKVNAFTLGELHARAEAILWKGSKDELQSQQRWRTCLDLLGKDTPVASVRRPQLEALARELGHTRGPKTVNRFLATVSRALRWAHQSDLIEGMPAIPWQKEHEGRKVFLPEHLTEAFLAHLEEPYRLAAEVLLLTGMRVSELLNLNPEDVDHDEVIHIRTSKTWRPRSLPLPKGRGDDLRRWLSGPRPAYRALWQAVTRASEACGAGRLTPHALRHTTATRLIARGVPSLTVAEIMGHSSLATTRQYTHHEVESLRQAIATISLRIDGAISERAECKALINKEDCAPSSICSPLRSHSATRP